MDKKNIDPAGEAYREWNKQRAVSAAEATFRAGYQAGIVGSVEPLRALMAIATELEVPEAEPTQLVELVKAFVEQVNSHMLVMDVLCTALDVRDPGALPGAVQRLKRQLEEANDVISQEAMRKKFCTYDPKAADAICPEQGCTLKNGHVGEHSSHGPGYNPDGPPCPTCEKPTCNCNFPGEPEHVEHCSGQHPEELIVYDAKGVCAACGVAKENLCNGLGPAWGDLEKQQVCADCIRRDDLEKAIRTRLTWVSAEYGDIPRKCFHCKGSRIVAGPGEFTTEPCPECKGEGVLAPTPAPVTRKEFEALKSSFKLLATYVGNRFAMYFHDKSNAEIDNIIRGMKS